MKVFESKFTKEELKPETKYHNSKVRLYNTELLHNKIINLPLWTHL